MNKPALAPALAAALLTALTIAAWTLWPTPSPEPVPAQAVPIEDDQFPGIEPSDCDLGSVPPARQQATQ